MKYKENVQGEKLHKNTQVVLAYQQPCLATVQSYDNVKTNTVALWSNFAFMTVTASFAHVIAIWEL